MHVSTWLQLIALLILLIICIPIMGTYMAAVFQGERHLLSAPLGWLEKSIYRLSGNPQNKNMGWKAYAKSLLYFNLFGLIFLFLIQLLQRYLPFNPQDFPGLSWPLAFNTAASFVTNTNWQAYNGENTLSYLTHMLGLTTQNFLSAATGIAVLLAFIRGLKSQSTETIGNFWVDVTRAIVYVLLPLSIVFALVLVTQGVIQNLNPPVEATSFEGEKQIIPQGPVASQIAIKLLGTNGGGFFRANSAHPYENPTAFSNFLETFALFILPISFVYMYGKMIGQLNQGILIIFVMFFLCAGCFILSLWGELHSYPALPHYPVLEGKETRIGSINSILWSTASTSTANAAVNSMFGSLSPLAGGIAMFTIMMREVTFGGAGVGLCNMLMFILFASFLGGLMVGRTPEYLGKKIEKYEIQWVMAAIFVPSALLLLGSSIASQLPSTLEEIAETDPSSLSALLYVFTSASGNNGSTLAAFNTDTPFYNLVLGFIMLASRLTVLIPILAIAGSFQRKSCQASSMGTLETDTPLFGLLLFSLIIITTILVFFPALSLGPLMDQIMLSRMK